MEFKLAEFLYALVNFLLLTGLLTWLLYKPVRKVIEKRREELDKERHDAETARRDAETLSAEYRQKLDGIDAERRRILDEGRTQAAENAQRVLAEAHEKAARENDRLERDLARTRRQALGEVQGEMVEVAVKLAGKALAAAADEELEEKLLARFAARLQTLTEEERSGLGSGASVRIATAHEADDERKKRIEDAVRKGLDFTGDFRWETDETLIAGLRAEFDTLAVDASLQGMTEAFKELCGRSPMQNAEETETNAS